MRKVKLRYFLMVSRALRRTLPFKTNAPLYMALEGYGSEKKKSKDTVHKKIKNTQKTPI